MQLTVLWKSVIFGNASLYYVAASHIDAYISNKMDINNNN